MAIGIGGVRRVLGNEEFVPCFQPLVERSHVKDRARDNARLVSDAAASPSRNSGRQGRPEVDASRLHSIP